MFDDIPQKNPAPPQNLPSEPVDMFAGVEEALPEAPSALDAGILKKKLPGASVMPKIDTGAPGEPMLYPAKAPVLGKIIMVVVVLIIAGGIGYGAWWFYSSYIMNTPVKTTTADQTAQPTQPTDQLPAEEAPEENVEFPVNQTTSTEMAPTSTATGTGAGQTLSETTDSDSDGLNDAREAELGTGVMIADTDRDGLSDGDEVLIWKTDPLNPDSDADGYKDGEEVRHGYNPLGEGKLFNNTGTTSISATGTTSTPPATPSKIITSTSPTEPI